MAKFVSSRFGVSKEKSGAQKFTQQQHMDQHVAKGKTNKDCMYC